MRRNGRALDELRPLTLEPGWATNAEGSCLISAGRTRVLCTASVEERLPPWREASGRGWVTGEYAMLPRSTNTRTSRERDGLRGRTQEIQRLIGRGLRSVTDLGALGSRTITVDCDVLQADGGTRTAAITGGWVALALACQRLVEEGRLPDSPVRESVAAVSVGLVEGLELLDLDYREDAGAQVDLNVVASASGGIVEVQGTAEGDPFRREELDRLLDLALAGVHRLSALQRETVRGVRTSQAL
jgi:ribonuclease PH